MKDAVYYTSKLKGREREKGIKIKMRVKLAAKLLIIAWTLMKKKEPFNPDYLKIDQELYNNTFGERARLWTWRPFFGPRGGQYWASH